MPKATRASQSPRAYSVFISHSSRDDWVAGVIAEKIKSVKAAPWIDDQKLDGGDLVADKILQGINQCREAIILVTPHSVQSQWVGFEIGAVRAQRKRVTPILYGVEYDAIAPMKDVKAIDLNDFASFLAQLKQRVVTHRKGNP